MQEESRRLLQDPNLTQEQRVQRLQDMRTQAEQRMQQLFGDKGAQILERLPGSRMAERYGLPATRVEVNPNPGVDNSVPANPP
jgi:hypothetical protein